MLHADGVWRRPITWSHKLNDQISINLPVCYKFVVAVDSCYFESSCKFKSLVIVPRSRCLWIAEYRGPVPRADLRPSNLHATVSCQD